MAESPVPDFPRHRRFGRAETYHMLRSKGLKVRRAQGELGVAITSRVSSLLETTLSVLGYWLKLTGNVGTIDNGWIVNQVKLRAQLPKYRALIYMRSSA